jgi:uncharacterized membrane protein YtjA (UPF0391 family)
VSTGPRAERAKIVFFIAVVLFVVSLVAGGVRGGFGRRL